MTRPQVALAHDYLTQLGGAERVVLALSRAFPGAPLHTTVHESGTTYAELDGLDIHTTPLQRLAPFRRNPRVALPLLAPAAGHHHIDADVTICNTTGWAHGMPVSGAKVVYAHNTPRWLYQARRVPREPAPLVRLGAHATAPTAAPLGPARGRVGRPGRGGVGRRP